jgi:hypothetical protein
MHIFYKKNIEFDHVVIGSLWMLAAVETWIQFLLGQDVNGGYWIFGRMSHLVDE